MIVKIHCKITSNRTGQVRRSGMKCVCVCVGLVGKGTALQMFFGFWERGRKREEESKWCHMYSMWNPPTPPLLPLVFFSRTFLWGLNFSPLPHETTAGFGLACELGDRAPPSIPPFLSSLPPSLHPQQILGTVSGQLLFLLFLLSGLSTMRLSLQNDDAFLCSRCPWHGQPPAALHPSHKWEPWGGRRVCVWVCVFMGVWEPERG